MSSLGIGELTCPEAEKGRDMAHLQPPVENADVVAVVVAVTDCSVCRPAAVVVDWGIAYGDGLGTNCARAACIS